MWAFGLTLLSHRWFRLALGAVALIGVYGVLHLQNTHLRSQLEATQGSLATANATATANAEAIRKMTEFQRRQEDEIQRVADQAATAAQATDEIQRRMKSARKTGADGPIAPAVRDGLELLYGTKRVAPTDRSAQPQN